MRPPGRYGWRLAGKKAQKFPFQSAISDSGGSGARVQNNVPSARHFLPVKAKNLPDPPLDAVPQHGCTEAFRHRNAQARLGETVRSIKHGA